MQSFEDCKNTVRHALGVKKGESIREAASRVLASEIESEAAKQVARFIDEGIHAESPLVALQDAAAVFALYQQI